MIPSVFPLNEATSRSRQRRWVGVSPSKRSPTCMRTLLALSISMSLLSDYGVTSTLTRPLESSLASLPMSRASVHSCTLFWNLCTNSILKYVSFACPSMYADEFNIGIECRPRHIEGDLGRLADHTQTFSVQDGC